MDSRSSGGDGWEEPLDSMTEVLHDLRLSGSFYCRSELRAPWGLGLPRRGIAMFHFVAEGSCYLRGGSEEALLLETGDLVLLPHGRGHALSASPDDEALPIDRLAHEKIGQNSAVLRHGGDGERTLLICGGVRFDDQGLHPLVGLMPDVLHIRGRSREQDDLLRAMLAAMGAEALSPKPGSATVMTRLADVLVIQAVRSWLDCSPEGNSGWLGALRDPQIGKALALIHRRPEESWSVGSLAEQVHMSRSVFSKRFTELVGTPAVQYLTRWRMHLAGRWLREDKLGLGEVAVRLGYESEPSFSRAFKRHMGVPPGQARRLRSSSTGFRR